MVGVRSGSNRGGQYLIDGMDRRAASRVWWNSDIRVVQHRWCVHVLQLVWGWKCLRWNTWGLGLCHLAIV